MLATLRFLINKPIFLIAAGTALVLAFTTLRQPSPARHINPWAVTSSASADIDSADAAAS